MLCLYTFIACQCLYSEIMQEHLTMSVITIGAAKYLHHFNTIMTLHKYLCTRIQVHNFILTFLKGRVKNMLDLIVLKQR